MQDINTFLAEYVGQNGSANVIVNGDYVDLDVDGVKQVNNLPADVYIVVDTGIDAQIAANVDAVLVASKDALNKDPAHYPKQAVARSNSSLMAAELSDNLFAFTKNGLPHDEPVVNTTIPPAPDVPLSISGTEEDVDEDVDVDEDDSTNEGMVW